MSTFQPGVQDREGCFVFQLIDTNGLEVRSLPSIDDECRTGVSFKVGDLVSVDLVRHDRTEGSDGNNGPFLRLSDCSGWAFQKKHGKLLMQEVRVESGLWCFYVDNVPTGQALRHHPNDNIRNIVKDVIYRPMQKIYCDRKVIHPDTGVCFYRVQGTAGWVFEKRTRDHFLGPALMLLQETMVEKGHFAYRAIENLAIRIEPDVDDSARTSRIISKGEIVDVDVIRKSSGDGLVNGPFLRLTDGSGWLFEKKHGKAVMAPLHVISGTWTFTVANVSGIVIRRQPIDSNMMKSEMKFPKGASVRCDRMVVSESGVRFYHVEKTNNGWVFDMRNGHEMLTLQTIGPPANEVSFSSSTSWTPDFVRGIAVSVDGLTEIAFTPTSRLISFRSSDGTRINVYYTTRTVGTAMDHPTQGKTQLFRRNCTPCELLDIFKNPRVHTGRGYQRREFFGASPQVSTPYGPGIIVEEEEEEIRNDLFDCEQEIQKLLKKRQELISIIRISELKRAEEATTYQKLVDKRTQELEEAERREREAEQWRVAEAARREWEARDLEQRTCSHCGRVFPNCHARAQHHRAVHEFTCDYCERVFNSAHSLNQHREAVGHW